MVLLNAYAISWTVVVRMLDAINVEFQNIVTEGDVETKFVTRILSYLGFKDENVFWKKTFKFKNGSRKENKQVDAYVEFDSEKLLVIEAKGPNVKLVDGIQQADFYAFNLETRYSLITNSKRLILRGYSSDNKKISLVDESITDENFNKVLNKLYKYIGINNIKRNVDIKISNNEIETEKNFIIDLKKCHTIIRRYDKLDPNDAFKEMSKLLFIKISEESRLRDKLTDRYSYKKFIEFKKDNLQKSYLNSIFKDMIDRFPKIFEEKEEIDLSDESIYEIMKILEKYDIFSLPVDIKGRAFESFLSTTLRGKGLGQYFTPRPIVNFMVNMVAFNIDDIVVDLACGTGGFLIASFNKILEIINSTPETIIRNKEDYINKIRYSNFFGIDAEPKAARTAKMNMAIWGDGENVYRGNGLSLCDNFSEKYSFNKGVDVILMNPPFGQSESDDKILNRYILSKNTRKTEVLFIERAIKLLKSGGRMGIVVPDTVLSSINNKEVRDFIDLNCKINAIISLPKFAFKQSGADVQTSIIFVEKTKIKKPYEIFLAKAENIGYSACGKSTLKGSENSDLDLISKQFSEGLADGKKSIWIKSSDFLGGRWDSRYHLLMNQIKEIENKLVELREYVVESGHSIDPSDFPDMAFNILTIKNDEGVVLNEDDPNKFEVMGVEFTQKYKKVNVEEIVYNPYRVNVGSIDIILKDYKNQLISPAYVCFKTKNGLSPEALVHTLKTKFYNEYMDVIGTGSVRNNLTFQILKEIKIPKKIINNKKFEKFYEKEKQFFSAKKRMQTQINDDVKKMLWG